MQAENSRIDSLHQEASSHYLRGEFQQALEVWRGVIELDPEDERALEGVRLCELLVDEGAAAAAESSTNSPPAEESPRPPFAEAAEGFDEDLDELDEILETGLGSSPAADKPAGESGGGPDEEPGVFFDFSNVPDITDPGEAGSQSGGAAGNGPESGPGEPADSEALPVGETSGEAAPIEQHSHEVDLPLNEATPEPEQAAEPVAGEATAEGESHEAAAAELRSRVNELLAEALTAYEQDHKEEALAILNRIFILDENNHAALALHDNIRIELEAEQASAGEDAEAAPPAAGEEGAAPDGESEPAGDTQEVAAIPLEAEAAEAGPLPSEAPLEEPFEDLDGLGDEEIEATPKRRLLGEGLLTRQNVFVAAALVVVVGLGGFLAFTFMGGSGEPAEGGDAASATAGVGPAVAVVLTEGVDDAGAAAPAAEAAGAVPTEPASQPPNPEVLARRLEDLLVQVRQAMAREDWSAAVLACNQALEIDPANTAVRDDLAEAGKRYREERALEERHQQAIEAFNDGNYRAALTLLYRLSPDKDGERIERYKRNGWYNMGIQALAVGDCKSATTHLGEARSVDPEDREILLALELAKTCSYSRDTETYRNEVRQLPLRGLDD